MYATLDGNVEEMGELIEQFLIETSEAETAVNTALTRDPCDFTAAYRSMHLIAGSTSYFYYDPIKQPFSRLKAAWKLMKDENLESRADAKDMLLPLISACMEMIGPLKEELQTHLSSLGQEDSKTS